MCIVHKRPSFVGLSERALLLLYRYGNSTQTRNGVHFQRIVQKPGYFPKDLESLDDREVDR
jgi:hypothetical protein